jgi:RNA polymerase sigma-70 factor, ECF subfamily
VQSNAASDDAVDFTALSVRLKESDPTAFEVLFRHLRRRLVAFVWALVRDADVADDIVQDVFVELWAGRRRIDADRSLKALLYRMARNRAYNHLRDRKTRRAKGDMIRTEMRLLISSNGHEPALDADMLGEALNRWLLQLPDRRRDALLLSRYEGLSHAEIARVMEISPRTVNNHIVRALRELNERLSRYKATSQP